jgi:hypothetical protein
MASASDLASVVDHCRVSDDDHLAPLANEMRAAGRGRMHRDTAVAMLRGLALIP